jgi:ubiquinone/menaquinone biosynthesis C-methylase UbiE
MYKATTNKNKFNNKSSISYDSFDNLIHKIFKPLQSRYKHFIKNIITETNTDNLNKSLFSISKLVTDEYTRNNFVSNENRQDFITTKIINYLRHIHAIGSTELYTDMQIIDIGGGNGNVLQQIATILDLKKEHVTCIESNTDWIENYDYNNSNISYMFWDNSELRIESNSINVVLCMVSLHHMTDNTIHNILKEIKRVLKPNGILLIKEHDTNSNSEKYIHWEHYLYHILDNAYKSKIIDPDNYLENAIENFKSKEEWCSIIETVGELTWKARTNRFLDGEFTNDSKNPTNLYWDIYVNNEAHK